MPAGALAAADAHDADEMSTRTTGHRVVWNKFTCDRDQAGLLSLIFIARQSCRNEIRGEMPQQHWDYEPTSWSLRGHTRCLHNR
jgi:hypothetical protein